jgi:tRNA A-37 threonylcarbamoyl transferase component Bud32
MKSSQPEIPTLFLDSIEDVFFKSWQPEKIAKLKEKSLANYFYVQASEKKKTHHWYYFEMRGRYIICRQKEDSAELAYMDIKNSFLKVTEGNLINGEECYGLKFVKKRTFEHLFTPNKEIFDTWLNALKRYCLLTKFRLHFETIKVISNSTFAKILQVRRFSDKKEFAVKVFSKMQTLTDPFEKKCLHLELKMLRKVRHFRVLRLHEIYEGENYVYCLCEFYPGPTLMESIIAKGSQPESKAFTIMYQILEALSYLHSQKIIHRDLKPDNIIMRNANNEIDVVILDLGFATNINDVHKLFSCCGTPGFIAPEVLNNKPYDCKADVYSAGLIFYTM